jgi:Na+/proline symporter
LSARSRRDASRALIASGFVVFAQFVVFLAIGIGLACFYRQFAPSSPIRSGDEAYARFIVTQLPAGVVGITLAGVFAAAMSTLSSSLNSSAAALIGDFGNLLRPGSIIDRRPLLVSRIATVVFGAIQIGIALAAPSFSSSVVKDALAIAAFSAGILLGVFLLGLLPVHVTPTGALAGMSSGLILLLLVKYAPLIDWPGFADPSFIRVAWPWYPVIGSVATAAVGVTVSAMRWPGGSSNVATR